MTRKAISKKLRFEVFKRDSFKCQYCGKSAISDGVILHCDHILPVVKGGETCILNLTTACFDCNLGKGKVILSENHTLERQKAQLELLQQKREQTQLLIQWKKELNKAEDHTITQLAKYWDEITESGFEMNDTGKKNLRKLLKRFSLEEVLIAMKISADYYPIFDVDSYSHALNKIGGICHNRRVALQEEEERF